VRSAALQVVDTSSRAGRPVVGARSSPAHMALRLDRP
jgi:hypothetical protein